MQLETGR